LSERDVLIVGAGLAGLAAAERLAGHRYSIVETEASIGGLCRSVRVGGFTFDYTGHLLHMKRPEIRDWVFDHVGRDRFLEIDRRSGVYSHGVVTEYPFQVNMHGLPKSVVRECVTGFAGALAEKTPPPDDASFERWALATFGPGICRHFMIPYNEKLYRCDLRSMSADWVSWSIPKPTWTDVVAGALGRNTKRFGYNPTFFYPAAGGIDALPNAFAPRIRNVRLRTAVTAVDAERRIARLSTGETIEYRSMISTVPLPRLLGSISDLPAALADGARGLRHVSVLNLNLGFDAPCPMPHHWLYFAEPKFPFYRVGVYSNLCPASVPEGQSAFYVEISHRPDEAIDAGLLEPRVVEMLRNVGLIPASARVRARAAFDIPYGYVIHDWHRRSFLLEAHRFLERHGIFSVGRYGAWEYSAMEDAIWHGRTAAERAVE
jgi:protoporphyrinogen oxidase